MEKWANVLTILGALAGAAGVAAAAGAAHGFGGPDLAIAANFLLFHASAICAVSLSSRRERKAYLAAGGILAAGAAIFCGDLADRALSGTSLFPLAAPTGGTLLILGWIALALAAGLDVARRQ